MITKNFIWPDSLLAKTTELKNGEEVILFGLRNNESIILKDMVISGSKGKGILPKILIGGVLVGTAVMSYIKIKKVIKNKKK